MSTPRISFETAGAPQRSKPAPDYGAKPASAGSKTQAAE